MVNRSGETSADRQVAFRAARTLPALPGHVQSDGVPHLEKPGPKRQLDTLPAGGRVAARAIFVASFQVPTAQGLA